MPTDGYVQAMGFGTNGCTTIQKSDIIFTYNLIYKDYSNFTYKINIKVILFPKLTIRIITNINEHSL